MIKKFFKSLFILSLTINTLYAQTLNITVPSAGKLAEQLTDSVRFTVENLTVSGPLNSADLKIIHLIAARAKVKKGGERLLTALDLSKAVIVDEKKNDTITTNALPINFLNGSKSLKSLVLPDHLTSLGRSSIAGCSNLQKVIIPSTVTEIGDGAFRGCELLEEITVPASVTKIDDDIFRDCTQLR